MLTASVICSKIAYFLLLNLFKIGNGPLPTRVDEEHIILSLSPEYGPVYVQNSLNIFVFCFVFFLDFWKSTTVLKSNAAREANLKSQVLTFSRPTMFLKQYEIL